MPPANPSGFPDTARGLPRLTAIALLALAYYFSARWSLLLAFEGTNASPVWPPSGLAFGAMLLLGRRVWPAILFGALTANMATFSANHVAGPTAIVSLCIALGNTLEALAGFHLLQALKIIEDPLKQPQEVFKFMMTTLLMSMVGAAIGTTSLIVGGIAPMTARWPIWINWWLGDVGGVLLMTPLMLVWLARQISRSPSPARAVLKRIALLAGFVALALLIFSGAFSPHHTDRLLLYLCLPYLAWIAYLCGQRGVSLASLLLAGIAAWETAHGNGPFALGGLNNSLILLVSFIVLCCVTGLVLAADIMQRAQFKQTPVTAADIRTPWLTLLAALAATVFTWHVISSETESEARNRFTALADDTLADINQRMSNYAQVVRSGVALFSASQNVTHHDWRHFVDHLELDKMLPGLQALAYAEWVGEAGKQRYLQRVRAEGFSDYAIYPAGTREAYVPITYIEPFNATNRRAFGYDMLFEANRRAAILHARDTGHITISGKVRLAQENGENAQPGFIMYAPIYRSEMPTATAEQRRHALVGVIGSGFRMNDLIAGTLGAGAPLLGLEIFDGGETTQRNSLYVNAALAQLDRHSFHSAYIAQHALDMGDHIWTLRLTSLPVFENSIDRQKAQIVLVSGIVVSLLLFILVRSLAMTRENALILANEMTAAMRETEGQLRLLNSRLELAAEAGSIGVWNWDIPANVLTWDKRMYAIYGVDPAAAGNTYQMWKACIHPDDLPRVERALSEAMGGGMPFSQEFRVVPRAGEIRMVKANALISRNEAGEAQFMVGVNFDITELRQTEESLRASETRFRNIFEHAPIGMAIVALDGHWLDFNGAICDIVGYDRAELQQLTFQDITHPDDIKDDLAHLEQLVQGTIRAYQMEKRYIRKDGKTTWVLLAVSLMRDKDNAPLYFIAQIEDINQLKLSETRLQETLALKSAILSSANQSIIATDTEGTIVSFNHGAERMLGYREQEVTGILSPVIIHDASEIEQRAASLSMELGRPILPGFEVFVAKARQGYADEHEWTYIRKDGSRFPVLLSVTAIRDQAGTITGFLGIATDIADRKQKERVIAAALAEKEVLLKEVYHRVKNNLQVITSLFNLQLRTLPDGAARVALKESADRVRAMALVHEKLYQSSDLSSIALDSYIRELCRQFGAAAALAERSITLSTDTEAIDIGLELAVPLGLLLNELVSNSLKHAFPNERSGKILVSLKHDAGDPDMVELKVIDNGVGLPANMDINAMSSLGLKLVQTLSAQIDGKFSLASDHGTCATLLFHIDESGQPDRMPSKSSAESI